MLSVTCKKVLYAECHYAKCRYAECCYGECVAPICTNYGRVCKCNLMIFFLRRYFLTLSSPGSLRTMKRRNFWTKLKSESFFATGHWSVGIFIFKMPSWHLPKCHCVICQNAIVSFAKMPLWHLPKHHCFICQNDIVSFVKLLLCHLAKCHCAIWQNDIATIAKIPMFHLSK